MNNPPDMLQQALDALSHGLAVFPLAPKSKIPRRGSHGFEDATRAEAQVREWWKQHPDSNVGIATGRASGIFVIDVDPREGGLATYKDLAKEFGPWDKDLSQPTARVTSGRGDGGGHVYFKLPEGRQVSSGKFAQGVDVKAEGGYVVGAGSIHPDSKLPYMWSQHPDDTGGFHGAPDWVLAMLPGEREDVPPERVHAPVRPPPQDGSDERPGDQYNREARWEDILGPAGWHFVRTRGDEQFWRRPGKRDGLSATTNYKGSGLLWVFSTNAAPFEADTGYSKFGAYALLHHNEDYQAAAADLSAQGYGAQVAKVRSFTPDDFTAHKAKIEAEVAEVAAQEVSVNGAKTYSPPKGGEYVFEHIFPDNHFVTQWINYGAAMSDTAYEYHEAVALIALACATKNLTLKLKPWPDGLHTNFWMILVGPTTRARKSTSVKPLRNILDAVIPKAPLADKFSAEALIQGLGQRNGAPSIWMPDEFGQSLQVLSRGRNGPGVKEAMLQVYDGRNYTYERHDKRIRGGGSEQDVDRIQDPHFSIIANTTPTIIEENTKAEILSGFFPRFQVVMPEVFPPMRPVSFMDDANDYEFKRLRQYIADLVEWNNNLGKPVQCTISQEALDILNVLDTDVNRAAMAGDDDMAARIPPTAFKLAMLAAAGSGIPGLKALTVEPEHAIQAVAIARKWWAYARAFGGSVHGVETPAEATVTRLAERAIKRWQPGQTVTRTEAVRYLQCSADQLTRMQNTLVEWGRIEVVILKESGKSGRPPIIWTWLPQVTG